MSVLVVVGVGGMGAAIARRLGSGRQVLLADHHEPTLTAVAEALRSDGYDIHTRQVDVAAVDSVHALAQAAAEIGPVTQVAHTAGLSPSQADAGRILAVDLLGVALMLDEFGAVIAPGGAGVVVASMAGHLFPSVTAEQEHALAHTAAAELLDLPFLRELTEPAPAYGITKQANLIRVRAASAAWGRRSARINSISPGIISTPMGRQELDSPLGEGIRAMIASSPSGRVGTPGDIAAAAGFLLGPEAAFITGTDVLVDGGVVASTRSA